MSHLPKPVKRPRVNVRRPDVMELVSAEIANHFNSAIVTQLRDQGGRMTVGNTTLLLAQQFGFCYGVERAIDLAYASRRVFPDNRIFLIGEIIHNPDVNRHLREMDIVSLPWQDMDDSYEQLTPDDVVIVPAFGAPTAYMEKIHNHGCYVIDTTCGDVMKVWRRVRSYAQQNFTSIIHGKSGHEETRATASRALGENDNGQYLIVLTLEETDIVCDYIRNGGDKQAFLDRFASCYSPGFNPDTHLRQVGIANQTTMLKNETQEIQNRIRQAIIDRDGNPENFQMFDTICGATQERQDALIDLLHEPMDALFVVGGYNSSNTAHLVEIAEKRVPTFFIRGADCIRSFEQIVHFDLHHNQETTSHYDSLVHPDQPATIGVTAGASCPNNLIEDTLFKILELRGIERSTIPGASDKG